MWDEKILFSWDENILLYAQNPVDSLEAHEHMKKQNKTNKKKRN